MLVLIAGPTALVAKPTPLSVANELPGDSADRRAPAEESQILDSRRAVMRTSTTSMHRRSQRIFRRHEEGHRDRV